MISSFRRLLETWYFRAFFILMVASFLLWGVGDMLRVIGTSSWVAKVAGMTIDGPAMQGEFQRAMTTASRDLPNGQEVTPELRRQVGEQTLQRLIGQVALTKTLNDMRVVVPVPALVDATHKMPAFKGADGAFDKARFAATIRENGLTEAGFLDMMRGDLARRQLFDAVTAGARVPDAEARPIYAMQLEKRSADIAAFPFAAMGEPPVPDEATARRWFDNHPDLYAIPEYRRVKLLVLSPRTVAADVTVSDEDVQAAYEAHQSDYTTTARRSVQVISSGDEAVAKKLVETWRAGASWPEMEDAAKAAGAVAVAQDDAAEKEFPDPDLAKAMFAAAEDVVGNPVKGAFGWFVVRVTKITPGGLAPFNSVKETLRARVVTEKSLELVYDRANKIDALFGNGATIESLPAGLGAREMGVSFDRNGLTPEETRAVILGEDEIRAAVIAAAFDAGKDDQPHLTEVQTPSNGGSGYYAVMVDGITPPGAKTFDSVRDAIDTDWRTDQRRRAAEQGAASLLAAVKNGKTFSDAARDAGVPPTLSPLVTRTARDPAMPPAVQNVLFTLKLNDPAMVETAEGFLVAVPVEIISPDPAADAAGYEQLRAAVAKTISNDLSSTMLEALRQRANPRINQTNVDQIVQP